MYLLSSRIFEVTCCRNTPCLAFSFQNSHWIVSCWCVSKDFFGKCQRFWALGLNWATFFHFFVRPKRFFPDAACPASLPSISSCGCLFPNSCVHASLCSLKKSHPKGFLRTPTKWIGSRFLVFSGLSSSCKRFLDTYGFSLFARPTRNFGWRQKIARV